MDNAEFEQVKTRHGAEIEREGEMERAILDRAADVRNARQRLEDEFQAAKDAGVETFTFCMMARHFESITDAALSHELIGLHEMLADLRRQIAKQPNPPATPPMQAG